MTATTNVAGRARAAEPFPGRVAKQSSTAAFAPFFYDAVIDATLAAASR